MATLTLEQGAVQPLRSPGETFVRRGLIALMVLACLAVSGHFAVMLWAENEFTQPESIVAAQSAMLAQNGTLYYDLKHYPYTVCAYMPLFYLIDASLIKCGVAPLRAGRLISFSALLGIFWLVWRLVLLRTRDRYCAWLAALLCGSSSILLCWGSDGQVDTLAAFFSVAALYFYSRYSILGRRTLLLAGVFVLAALFTKQTALAAPAAIFLSLLIKEPKTALRFTAATGGLAIGVIFLLDSAMHGRFLTNVVFANMNPFAMEKLRPHIQTLLLDAGQLIIIVLLGFRRLLSGAAIPESLYLGFAMSILAVTAPKIGSDSNYHIEPTVALILCACLVLHALDFFPLLFRGSKVWITLLQAPLAIQLLLNYRSMTPFLAKRVANEKMFREQVLALRPYFSGRVLSAEMNAVTHFGGRIEVEPLIYKLLVRAGRIDPEPVRRDIARESFSTIVLYQDLTHPAQIDLEIPSLPQPQMEEIRKHYNLVRNIPGPYQAGVWVYQPSGGAER